jgi:hypothetical protein
MQRTVHPGLIRPIRQDDNDSGGCSGSFQLDAYIDEYRGFRLGYVLWNDGRRYPNARVSRHLGGSTLSLGHQTGEESGESLTLSGRWPWSVQWCRLWR